MPQSIDMEALLKLSPRERARIAEVLICSLESDTPPGPSEAEIRRRVRDLKENPDRQMLTWEDLCESLGWDE